MKKPSSNIQWDDQLKDLDTAVKTTAVGSMPLVGTTAKLALFLIGLGLGCLGVNNAVTSIKEAQKARKAIMLTFDGGDKSVPHSKKAIVSHAKVGSKKEAEEKPKEKEAEKSSLTPLKYQVDYKLNREADKLNLIAYRSGGVNRLDLFLKAYRSYKKANSWHSAYTALAKYEEQAKLLAMSRESLQEDIDKAKDPNDMYISDVKEQLKKVNEALGNTLTPHEIESEKQALINNREDALINYCNKQKDLPWNSNCRKRNNKPHKVINVYADAVMGCIEPNDNLMKLEQECGNSENSNELSCSPNSISEWRKHIHKTCNQ